MHGLINRSIQAFVVDTYGQAAWEDSTLMADVDLDDFEALLLYDDDLTRRILQAIADRLERPVEDVLEDIGTYLVSHENLAPLRRLLRFGGETFEDFLFSLDDLHDRVRLAVPDLLLPQLRVLNRGGGIFRVSISWGIEGFGQVLMGVLRAMADDYGDLVFLENEGSFQDKEFVKVTILEPDFADGRDFVLAAGGGA